MSIHKPKTSRFWQISIYMGRGQPRRRIPTGTEDKAEALAQEALVKASLRGRMDRERFIEAVDALMGWNEQQGVPVDQIWTTYQKTEPKVSDHTLKIRRLLCAKLSKWLAEERPKIKGIHQIEPQTAIAFADWMRETDGGRGKTQNTKVGHLRTVFKQIYARAGMSMNPFDGVANVSQDDSLSGRPFTAEEQTTIFNRCAAAGNDWLAICTVAKYTGLRLKDIATMTWDMVNISDRHFDITPAKTKKHGIRVLVPIHPAVWKELAALGVPTTKALFPVLYKRYQDKNPDSLFGDEVLNHCGIETKGAHISFHCWRHTFATALSKAKVDKETRKKLGGWTQDSTAELYDHHQDINALTTAINSLE